MEALFTVIAIWLSVNFDLPAAGPNPKIEFLPAGKISRAWIESVAQHRSVDVSALKGEISHRALEAFYDDHRRTIFLVDGWSPESPQDVSVLVHELVHHLQNLDRRRYACPAEREKLAYQPQDAWLGLFKTSLEIQFEIDPMTLLVSTKCMH